MVYVGGRCNDIGKGGGCGPIILRESICHEQRGVRRAPMSGTGRVRTMARMTLTELRDVL